MAASPKHRVQFGAKKIRTYDRYLFPGINTTTPENEQNAVINLREQLKKYGYSPRNAGVSAIVEKVALLEEAERYARKRGVPTMRMNLGSRELIPRLTRANRVEKMQAAARKTRKARRRRS